MKAFLQLVFLFFCSTSFTQNAEVLKRLHAIPYNENHASYHIGNVHLIQQKWENNFDKKGLKDAFNEFSIRNKDVKEDSLFGRRSFYAKKTEGDDQLHYDHYFFVEGDDKKIESFRICTSNENPDNLEKQLLYLVYNKRIPSICYSSANAEEVNFIGRRIKLDEPYFWAHGTLHYPKNGTINWSLHENMDAAKKETLRKLNRINDAYYYEIVSETTEKVLFENKLTSATKLIYEHVDRAPKLENDKITTFYVTEKIRGFYVSCSLSYSSRYFKSKDGLPILLNKFILVGQ